MPSSPFFSSPSTPDAPEDAKAVLRAAIQGAGAEGIAPLVAKHGAEALLAAAGVRGLGALIADAGEVRLSGQSPEQAALTSALATLLDPSDGQTGAPPGADKGDTAETCFCGQSPARAAQAWARALATHLEQPHGQTGAPLGAHLAALVLSNPRGVDLSPDTREERLARRQNRDWIQPAWMAWLTRLGPEVWSNPEREYGAAMRTLDRFVQRSLGATRAARLAGAVGPTATWAALVSGLQWATQALARTSREQAALAPVDLRQRTEWLGDACSAQWPLHQDGWAGVAEALVDYVREAQGRLSAPMAEECQAQALRIWRFPSERNNYFTAVLTDQKTFALAPLAQLLLALTSKTRPTPALIEVLAAWEAPLGEKDIADFKRRALEDGLGDGTDKQRPRL